MTSPYVAAEDRLRRMSRSLRGLCDHCLAAAFDARAARFHCAGISEPSDIAANDGRAVSLEVMRRIAFDGFAHRNPCRPPADPRTSA